MSKTFSLKSSVDTHWARIYIAGDLDIVEEACREYCESGYCVNVYESNYIYQFGEQMGVVVELINYARFPESEADTAIRAGILGTQLAMKCHQRSFTIMTNYQSYYYQRD